MVFYEVCNLYEEHYNKYELIGRLNASGFTYFGILHNKDYFPTGEPKKSHFHLILGVEGDSRHTKDKVIDFFNDSSLLIRNIRNPKGFARYLTHKDNLEKQQYNDSDVFTNDKTLYEELITIQIKMSSTDNILNKFKDYILYGNFDFYDKVNCSFEYFDKMGKIDYFLKNKLRILDFVDLVFNNFMKNKEIK